LSFPAGTTPAATANALSADARLALSIDDTCRMLGGISRTLFHRMVKRGDLRTVKLGGRRTVVPMTEITRLLHGNAAVPAA